MADTSSMARRWGRAVFALLTSLVLAALFYTAVVVGHPSDTREDRQDGLQATGQRPVAGGEASSAIERFPGSALLPQEDAGWTVVSEALYELPSAGGSATALEITWQTDERLTLTAVSLAPATAQEALLRQDDLLLGEGPAIAGCRTLRFRGSQRQCLTFTEGSAAYAVYADAQADLDGAVRRLRLYWSPDSPGTGGNE